MAHRMDPARRELYVEGVRDRIFLGWLAGSRLQRSTIIVQSAQVEIPLGEGGERGRLLEFARQCIGRAPPSIAFFADADVDPLLGLAEPQNVWLTDHRDMEAYVLNVTCIDKALRVGFACDDPDAQTLLSAVMRVARTVGALQVVSGERKAKFPFQSTDVAKYTDFTAPCACEFRLDAYVQALLQNATPARSIGERPGVLKALAEMEKRLDGVPDSELVHGKTALALMHKAIRCLVAKDCGSIEYVLWTSFDPACLPYRPSLARVVEFLAGNCGGRAA
jgi:hypothetical protein